MKRGGPGTDGAMDVVCRAALWIAPRSFRERYADAVLETIHDRVRAERRAGGVLGAARAWARALTDLLASAVAERGVQFTQHGAAIAAFIRDARHPEFDADGYQPMTTFLADIRHSVRAMLARPAVSAVILATLALGIGANTAIFSVIEGVLLRALPFGQPGGIVHVAHGSDFSNVSEPEFVDYRDQARSFARVAGYAPVDANLTGDRDPERITASRVSEGFFEILGVTPVRGRVFTADEDRRGGPRVVMISYGLWLRQFGGDSAVVGKALQLNGNPYTVIGVLPAHFDYPNTQTSVWVPLRLNYDTLWTRNNHYLQLIARLAPGATAQSAQRELTAMTRTWPAKFPETYAANKPPMPDVTPISDVILGRTRPYLYSLLGAVAFVLLIACVNVANLLLARAESRRREFAIRTALGATRGRIIRQAMTESALYALGGAVLALPLAWWGWRALRAIAPASIPRLDLISLDLPVLGFTFGVAALTGLVFGIVPAMRAAGGEAGDALKLGGKSSGQGRGLRRARTVLVVTEVALAVVTLMGAGLMLRSLAHLESIDVGLKPSHVLTVQVSPSPRGYSGDRLQAFYADLLTRVRSLPTVLRAGAVADLPIADGHSDYSILLDGQAMTTVAGAEVATPEQVIPGYFEAMGIPVVRGRTFTDDDKASGPLVAIVNEAMVRKYWPNTDPIGHTIRMLNANAPWATVVGVVGDVRHGGYQADAPPTMYFPYDQSAQSVYYAPTEMSLVVKTTGDETLLAAPIRAILRDIDPTAPVARMQSMDALLSVSIAGRRFSTQLLALFAGLALILAAIGIYGVMSYGVSQRSFELGLRLALGARQEQVMGLVVREGVRLAALGTLLGGVGAVAIMRLARGMLVNTSIADPATLGSVAVVLVLVAACASWIPARRVAALQPTDTLRSG